MEPGGERGGEPGVFSREIKFSFVLKLLCFVVSEILIIVVFRQKTLCAARARAGHSSPGIAINTGESKS